MTSNTPEDIRRDIEATRSDLSRDVDALTEKVSPARVVERRVDRAKGALSGVKDTVMGGSSDSPYDNGSGGASSSSGGLSAAGDTLSAATSSVSDAASSAPEQARARTQGNPLAAGLVAFGAGWLISSLLPASEKEQQAATAVKEKASEHSDTLKQPLTEAAQEIKENLKEPAAQAAQSVKSTAQEGAEAVKGEARSAADDVSSQARDSKEQVADPSGTSTGAPSTGDTSLDVADVRDERIGSRSNV
jgi:gas vesicle protein